MNLNSGDLNSPQDARLREMLDALRPGSDDLSRSEFAELAQRLQRDPQFKEVAARSQRLDQAISDAMHDLPIPAGAVDRLLTRLEVPLGSAKQGSQSAAVVGAEIAGGQSRTGSPASGPSVVSPPVQGASATAKTSGSSNGAAKAASDAQHDSAPDRASRKRKWKLGLIEASVFAIVASLGAVAYYFSGSPVAYNSDQILNEAQDFAAVNENGPVDWQPMPTGNAPAILTRFAFAANSGLRVEPTAWREIHDLLSRSGVAYELHSGAILATLYVVERDPPNRFAPRFEDPRFDDPRMSAAPPSSQLVDSRGWAVSTWAQGDLLYVLVVKGGPQQYKAFVNQPGPLAKL